MASDYAVDTYGSDRDQDIFDRLNDRLEERDAGKEWTPPPKERVDHNRWNEHSRDDQDSSWLMARAQGWCRYA